MLAAGTSSRFGRTKLLVRTGGRTLIDRAIAACAPFATLVVASPAIAAYLRETPVTVVLNERPELGMTHSLRLANARIDAAHSIAVLPADLSHIEAPHVQAIVERTGTFDVTYPVSVDGVPGHPVVFSAAARARISALPAGDTLRLLRDDPELRRNPVVTEERWPFADVDRESDLRNP